MSYVYARNSEPASAFELPITYTCVPPLDHGPGMAKQQMFSAEQNAALRAALQAYCDEHGISSQAEIGRLLMIGQQTAGRFMRQKNAGIAYRTATRVAILAGFDGVDAFFSARGLAPWLGVADPDPFPNRQQAIRIARLLGASEEAVEHIRATHGVGFEARSTRWWVDEVLKESDELERIRARATASAATSATRGKPAKKRGKAA